MAIGTDDNGLTPAETDWIIGTFGPTTTVRSIRRLPGSTTATLFQFSVDTAEGTQDLVLKRYVDADYAADMARQEAWAIPTAASINLPTPTLFAVDVPSDDTASLSKILMSCIPGKVVLQPTDIDEWLREMACAMFRIHRHTVEDAPYQYYPWFDGPLAPPSWSTLTEAWSRAIEIANGPAPDHPPHFIHRDFHPCNVLFVDNRLNGVGIIDWACACQGMAGVDIAHCRWNLALMHGVDVADRFVEIYREFAGPKWVYEPYFDMVELCEKIGFTPGVYPGWTAFGMTGLNDALMLTRTEALLLSALSRV